MSDDEIQLTHHGMLIAWGQFAQCLGLVEQLENIPIKQKTVKHTPQCKIIEYLVAILSGLPHLKDISLSAHPLDQDEAAAKAWGQASWADYSGVSRTLASLSGEEVSEIIGVIQRISQPFIDKEVVLTMGKEGKLVLDGDLSGRSVSSASTTYPEVGYGYMNGSIQLGYQGALVSMQSPTYGRFWLSVAQHPGDTVACTQVERMVQETEDCIGRRPLRRVDLLSERVENMAKHREEQTAGLWHAECALEKAQSKLAEVVQLKEKWRQKVADLEQSDLERQREAGPYSQLAKARKKHSMYLKRLDRRKVDLKRAERCLKRCLDKWKMLGTRFEILKERLDRFNKDNVTNSAPIRAEFRLDAGFGSPENIAFLIEMGYDVYAKPSNNWITPHLKRRMDDQTKWKRVGKNAEMTAWKEEYYLDFPYPLDLALERFHGGSKIKYSGMIHFGQKPVTDDLPGWFTHYNARQIIEAGNKEEKQIFELHHLKVRSHQGILLQEYFTAFAANFIRWATLWLAETCHHIPDGWKDPSHPRIKDQVKVGARLSAWVSWFEQGCLLRFEDHSVFAGRSLEINKEWIFQPVLPFAKNAFFSTF